MLCPQPAQASDNCYFNLNYMMFGQTMGTLNVYQQTVVNGYATTLLSRSGDLGQVWVTFTVTLTSTQPFQLVIEGVRGSNYYSDIAIDDISLSAGCRYAASGLGVFCFVLCFLSFICCFFVC
jgi:hypothetical protein